MKLTFYGAAREVTGSCTLIETGNVRVLVDCGFFQGASLAHARNAEPFAFDPKTLDAVILTHAHIDHIGRFPMLVKQGFKGRTFVTHPTRQLCKLMWIDAAKVMKDDAKREHGVPIYTLDEVFPAYQTLHGVEYGTPVHVKDDFRFTFREAGHIFGSAFVEIEAEGKHVVFSGDIGNDNVPILRSTESITVAPDLVVLEATYGDRVHEGVEERRELLKQAVKDTVKRQGTLMVPAFSLERTQELLYELNAMVEGGELKPVPMYLDSPLAIKVLPIYHRFPEYYNREAAELAKHDDFFQFPGLHITRTAGESRAIKLVPAPKVIIAGSGMMHGGRIMRHLVDYISHPENTVLVVGYQAAGTIGRAVSEGATRIHIEHQELEVKAHVEIIGAYSAHADQLKLLKWSISGSSKPKRIILNHGEVGGMEVLAGHFRDGKGIPVEMPEVGKTVEV
ncbi:MAG: MBL fold metallo-hydrolase [Patescibacteria group bacterium]|nr:MBL fold metallo-hydrolase [Patescibacteria group bacterium]